MAYAVIDTSNVSATRDGSKLKNIRFVEKSGDNLVETSVENATLVVLDKLVPGQHDLFYATAPTSTSKVKDILIIETPELIYDESTFHPLSDFINLKGSNSVAFKPESGDQILVSAESFATTPDEATIKTKFIDISTSGKLAIAAAVTAGTTLGYVTDIVTVNKIKMFRIMFNF